MNITHIKSVLLNKEVWLQTILWSLFFASINVIWTQSWIAEEFLPKSVAPHIALAVPIIFLVNVFLLIPKLLSKRQWFKYIWLSLSLLIGFEIARTLVFTMILQDSNSFVNTFKNELFGDNSLIFGPLNILIFHIIFYSFVYVFTRDWLFNQGIIERLKFEKQQLQTKSTQVAGNMGFNISDFTIAETIQDTPKPIKKTLAVKKRNGIFILHIGEIVCFQAQGDFVFAFDSNNNKHIVNESLKTIKEQICQESFFQINRSELINFNYITKFNSYTKNRLEISLANFAKPVYTSNNRTPGFRLWVEQH